MKVVYYNKMSFSYTFGPEIEKVYFSYCFPYTFSMLTQLLKRQLPQTVPNLS